MTSQARSIPAVELSYSNAGSHAYGVARKFFEIYRINATVLLDALLLALRRNGA